MVSVNIVPMAGDNAESWSTNALYHTQRFVIEGEAFGDIAPTIDGMYAAIRGVVDAAAARPAST